MNYWKLNIVNPNRKNQLKTIQSHREFNKQGEDQGWEAQQWIQKISGIWEETESGQITGVYILLKLLGIPG